jgi:hypothetical protein
MLSRGHHGRVRHGQREGAQLYAWQEQRRRVTQAADDLLAPLRLAATCCRRTLSPAKLGLIRSLADGADWDFMLRLFRRHRIEPLARRALRAAGVALPEQAATGLRQDVERVTAANLHAAGVMARLQTRFAEAQVDLLFIKGLTLGQLAYGNFALKSGWDIDLLVREADIGAAADFLETTGFVCVIPGPAGGRKGLLRWHGYAKESVWRDDQGIFIDLHDGLADHPHLIPAIGMASPRQNVGIGGQLAFPTLAVPELYAYLTVHGGWSGWSRLKWAADVAALLEPRTSAEITELHRTAEAAGAERASALTLLLCRRLFGTVLDEDLARELRADRGALTLLKVVEAHLTGRGLVEEMDAPGLGTGFIHRVQYGLAGGTRYKAVQAGIEFRRFRNQVAKRLAPRA